VQVKQTVRKLAIRPKNVAQNSVCDDSSGSDQPGAAKTHLNFGIGIASPSFRTACKNFAPRIDVNESVGYAVQKSNA
jgi:hypothetical protein